MWTPLIDYMQDVAFFVCIHMVGPMPYDIFSSLPYVVTRKLISYVSFCTPQAIDFFLIMVVK